MSTALQSPGNGSPITAKTTKTKKSAKKKIDSSVGEVKQQIVDIMLTSRKPGAIHHCMTQEHMLTALVRRKKMPKTDDMPLDQIAGMSVYREDEEPDGQIGWPKKCLMAALSAAGRKVNLKGRVNMSRADGSGIVRDAIDIEDDWLIMYNPETGEPCTDDDWKPRIDRVKLPGTNTTSAAVRPHFKQWCMKLRITVNLEADDNFTAAKAVQLFTIAGKNQGLGA